MIDNEIIKALKCCCNLNGVGCRSCPQYDIHSAMCVKNLIRNALDLINRQKAEIERYKSGMMANAEVVKAVTNELKTAKSVAIKEFVYTLKNRVVSKYDYTDIRIFDEIDNLVKEMTEKNNNFKEGEK